MLGALTFVTYHRGRTARPTTVDLTEAERDEARRLLRKEHTS